MSRVVGLDLSLTSTGVAIIQDGMADVNRVRTGADSDSLTARSHRLRAIVARVWATAATADLVVVESPTYAVKSSGSQHDRSGLWWLTVARLTGANIPVVEVPISTLKVYGAGTGRCDKDQLLVHVVRRWPAVDVRNNDEADALLLASMGCRALGHPFEALPLTHTRAMAAVVWPFNRQEIHQP